LGEVLKLAAEKMSTSKMIPGDVTWEASQKIK